MKNVLALIIGQMAVYITPEIRNQAREHLREWFGGTDHTVGFAQQRICCVI